MNLVLKTQAQLDLARWLLRGGVSFRMRGHLGNWHVVAIFGWTPGDCEAVISRGVYPL